jgi:membrane protein
MVKLLQQTWTAFQQDQCGYMAAALAYYALFSCVPLILLVVSVIGLLAQNPHIERQILDQALQVLGPAASAGVSALIEQSKRPEQGLLATTVGLLAMAWGATGLVGQLQYSLNQIWRVRPRSDLGWKKNLLRRLRLLGLVLGGGTVLLISQVAATVLAALPTWVVEIPAFWHALEEGLSLLIFGGLFTGIFATLPDVRLSARQVFPGAMVTAFLFLLGRWGLNLYLSGGALSTAYGAAASLVVLLLWCNYSAQIVFVGAEFTKVMLLERGEVEPGPQGERIA